MCRKHGHPEWECEADPWTHLEPDRALSAGGQQLPTKEAHARLAQGNADDDVGDVGGNVGNYSGGMLKNGDHDGVGGVGE